MYDLISYDCMFDTDEYKNVQYTILTNMILFRHVKYS
jgi:hypothetical protein